MAIALGLWTAAGASSADAQTFDRFVVIQPIRVCDDGGNNCAVVNFLHAGTAKALGQAGVLPIFLPQTQFNSTALLASNNGPSSFDDSNGGSLDGNTINMWFTDPNSIVDCGGVAAIGCATTPGKQIVIDSQALIDEAAGNNDPYHRTIAHETGHSFGLDHVSGAGFAGNLMEVPNTVDRTGFYDEIGADRLLLNAGQITTIRADAKAQTTVNAFGDITLLAGQARLNIFGQGGNNLITLNAGSGVLQNVQGDDGDDAINVLDGSIVGGDVRGDANNDTLNIGGIVLNNVLGGTGDDDIFVLSTAQVIRDVDGGSGSDLISIAGTVAADPLLAIPATGPLPTATVPSPTEVRGGTDADTILVQAGANVAGSVFGDDNDGNEGNDAGDNITLSGGQVAGNIDGEGGNDIITISNGAVRTFNDGQPASPDLGGNVLGGGGSDTIEMTGGRIAGNVNGEDDSDSISILGGTVFGNVLGGGGGDTIQTREPGTIVGNVDGQAGNDTITIASDPLNVFGGIGDDTITLNAGTVVTASVFGDDGNGNEADGDGADIITMNAGASVAGDINGEGGGDTITINGGSVNRVLGGGGGDEGLWTGGTIASLVDMGAGSDRLTILGTAAGGTALQAGLIALDGGDDASLADGQSDILNLNGVVEVLTDLRNWEFINLNDATVADLGNATRTIVTEQFRISSDSTLVASSNVGGQTYTIGGNLVNFGSINMLGLNLTPYDTVAVPGTYDGRAGSTLALDSFLGAFGSPSDLLRVGTNTIGNTGLFVNDTNAAGPGVFNPIGIEVVRVEGVPGSTEKENFTLLGGPIKKDLWVWDLGLDATRANPGRANADVHVLYSRPGEIVQFTPYFATGALTAYQSSLDPWIDRQQTLADTVGSGNLRLGGLKDGLAAPKGTYVDLWAAPFGSRRSEDSVSTLTFFGDSFSARMDYDQSTYGFQAGVDLISIIDSGEAVMAGVFGGFLTSSISPDDVPVSGDYEGGSVGVYASYVRGGFSLSAVMKADLLNFDWEAPTLDLDAKSDVNTFGGRIEAAYKHPILGSSWLEPYTNLTYAKSYWDQYTVLATTFDLDENESLLGRGGLRIGTDFRSSDTQLMRLFAGVGVVHEFDGTNTANIVSGGFTLPLTHDVDPTSLEVQGGFKLEDFGTGLAVSVTSTGRLSEDTEEYGGKATVNYRF